MALRKYIAEEGKIWAFTDDEGNIVKLSNILYLGIEDKLERYYQIVLEEEKENNE